MINPTHAADALPDPLLARQIIETLGQFGTPLARGVSYYNVGNGLILDALDKHYLSSYLPEGGAVFKLVVGDYGSGKSHFLYAVQDLAWQHHFVVSKVDLSPKETAYDDQRRIYQAVASSLVWPNATLDSEDRTAQRGLVPLLEATIRRLAEDVPHSMNPETGELYEGEPPEIAMLRTTIHHTPIDSLSYKQAILSYIGAFLVDSNSAAREALMHWLHGEEVPPAEMRILRPMGVTEKINKNNAFRMLRSLCQTVRALSYNGLVLLFDEVDRMLSMSGRAEQNATDNLREVIDRCREDLPGTLFMYAVPPDFVRSVIPKYQALDQRIKSPYNFSRANPFSPQINLETLDLANIDVLIQIGRRLLPIFEVAYNTALDTDIQDDNIAVIAQASYKLRFDPSHRRLFIKTLVAEWYHQMDTGEVRLSSDDAAQLVRNEARSQNDFGE